MTLKTKLYYYFKIRTNRDERLFFLILFATLVISAYLICLNLYGINHSLAYLKLLYFFLNLIFLYLFIKKKISIKFLSIIFMFFLFLFLMLNIIFSFDKIEILLFLLFFVLITLMMWSKKLAFFWIFSFFVIYIILNSFNIINITFTLYEIINIFFAIIIIAILISLFIDNMEYNQTILKEKNLQLNQRYKLFSDIFNQAPMIFSSFNSDGRLIYISDFELQLMKKRRNEVQNRHYRTIYQHSPKLIKKFDALYAHNEAHFSHNIYGRDFNFKFTKQNNENKNLVNYSMTAMDVTEYIKMQEELKYSQDRLDILTSATFEAVIISQKNKIIQANQKAIEIFGYDSIKEIINENITKFIPKESMNGVVKYFLTNDESPYFMEGINRNGTTFPMQIRGKTICYFGQTFRILVVQSLDAIYKAKKEIAKLAKVVEQNSSIIIISDKNAVIEYVNQAFVNKMEYTRKEVYGHNLSTIYFKNEKENFYDTLLEKLNRKNIWVQEMNNCTKSGVIIAIKNTIFSIKNEKEEVTNYITMQEDITHIKEQERIFFAQTKQAQMGEILGMIAHQWRQPLSAISAIGAKLRFALELKTIDDHLIKDSLSHIDKQVEFLSDTIDDFRNFFKPNNKAKSVHIQKLIKKAVSIIYNQLELNNVTLEVNGSCNPEIITYNSELIQVILNLLKNSLDQLKSKLLANKIIRIKVEIEKKMCLISICDTAGGIPLEIINDIFLPYFSTKHEKQGTGLGLHMSKTIIEKHCQGTIAVKNLDDGACFLIKLPMVHTPNEKNQDMKFC